MTIIIDQPEFGVGAEEKKIPIDQNELVFDGGFVVPETNSFGHTFSVGVWPVEGAYMNDLEMGSCGNEMESEPCHRHREKLDPCENVIQADKSQLRRISFSLKHGLLHKCNSKDPLSMILVFNNNNNSSSAIGWANNIQKPGPNPELSLVCVLVA